MWNQNQPLAQFIPPQISDKDVISNIDWNLIQDLDPILIKRTKDSKTIQEFIEVFQTFNIYPNDFKNLNHPLTPNLVLLTQLGIDYLLHAIKQERKKNQKMKSNFDTLQKRHKKLSALYQKSKKLVETLRGELHTCPICEKRFKNANYLDIHFRRKHSQLFELWKAIRSQANARNNVLLASNNIEINPLKVVPGVINPTHQSNGVQNNIPDQSFNFVNSNANNQQSQQNHPCNQNFNSGSNNNDHLPVNDVQELLLQIKDLKDAQRKQSTQLEQLCDAHEQNEPTKEIFIKPAGNENKHPENLFNNATKINDMLIQYSHESTVCDGDQNLDRTKGESIKSDAAAIDKDDTRLEPKNEVKKTAIIAINNDNSLTEPDMDYHDSNKNILGNIIGELIDRKLQKEVLIAEEEKKAKKNNEKKAIPQAILKARRFIAEVDPNKQYVDEDLMNTAIENMKNQIHQNIVESARNRKKLEYMEDGELLIDGQYSDDEEDYDIGSEGIPDGAVGKLLGAGNKSHIQSGHSSKSSEDIVTRELNDKISKDATEQFQSENNPFMIDSSSECKQVSPQKPQFKSQETEEQVQDETQEVQNDKLFCVSSSMASDTVPDQVKQTTPEKVRTSTKKLQAKSTCKTFEDPFCISSSMMQDSNEENIQASKLEEAKSSPKRKPTVREAKLSMQKKAVNNMQKEIKNKDPQNSVQNDAKNLPKPNIASHVTSKSQPINTVNLRGAEISSGFLDTPSESDSLLEAKKKLLPPPKVTSRTTRGKINFNFDDLLEDEMGKVGQGPIHADSRPYNSNHGQKTGQISCPNDVFYPNKEESCIMKQQGQVCEECNNLRNIHNDSQHRKQPITDEDSLYCRKMMNHQPQVAPPTPNEDDFSAIFNDDVFNDPENYAIAGYQLAQKMREQYQDSDYAYY